MALRRDSCRPPRPPHASLAALPPLLTGQIVIFHGQTVATWRKAQYHLQEEHAAFAQLLVAPQEEAKEIMARRFPVPRLVDCDYQGSQVRAAVERRGCGRGKGRREGEGAGERERREREGERERGASAVERTRGACASLPPLPLRPAEACRRCPDAPLACPPASPALSTLGPVLAGQAQPLLDPRLDGADIGRGDQH